MIKEFPDKFTLDSGTEVSVNKVGENVYEFHLVPEEGPENRFRYVDDNRTKEEKEANLNFEQLNAVRKFWLDNEEIV